MSEWIYFDINEEGYIWSDVNIQGNGINFGDRDVSTLLPQDALDIFEWAYVWTGPANHPDDKNLHFEIVFRTNEASVAEYLAQTILLSMGSSVTISNIEFQGSEGWDDNHGDGWTSYTRVWYNSHVDWTGFQDIMDASIPRSLGGIAETADAYSAKGLNFNFWMDGDQIAAGVGLNYAGEIPDYQGGFSIDIADYIGVTDFKSSPYSNGLNIHQRLPDVSNVTYSLANTTDTTVYIKYEPSPETHNQHAAYLIDTYIEGSDSYSSIVITFDHVFTQWSWKNRDRVDWYVDERGYSRLSAEVFGVERAAPTFDLLLNSSLFEDILQLWLDFEPLYEAVPGHHTQWITMHYPDGYDWQTANNTNTDILNALGVLNLTFVDMWNNTGDTIYDPETDSYVPVVSMSYAGYFSYSDFANFLAATYAYSTSAMFQMTDLANVHAFRWNIWQDRWGPASSVRFESSSIHRAVIEPMNGFSQNIPMSQFIDLLNPVFFNWGGSIPWNSWSEEFELYFSSPFTGEWEDVIFGPDYNNGISWDSGRWFEDYTKQRFSYNLRVYSDDPRLEIWENDRWVDIGPLSQVNVSYAVEFADDNTDIQPPWIRGLYMYNSSWGENSDLWGYSGYQHIYDGATVSETIKLASRVQDTDYEDYWNGTDWVRRYPSSGIANFSSYMFRTDAPIDHPLFTKQLDFVENTTWIGKALDRQVWDGTLDTTQYPDGEWQIWAEVYDNDGNFGDWYGGSITVDNYDSSYMPAEIAFTPESPMEGEGVSQIAWFNFTVTDDAGVFAVIAWNNLGGYIQAPISSSTVDGKQVTEYAFKVDTLVLGLPENAPFTITIEVLDMDGYWSYQSVEVFIDNIKSGNPPTISAVSPADSTEINNTEASSMKFQVEINEDVGIKDAILFIDGPQVVDFNLFYNETSGFYEYTAQIGNWQLGEYSWYVEVTDLDENQHTVTSATFTFTIVGLVPVDVDSTAPTILLVNPGDGDEVSDDVEIRVEVTDDVQVSQVSLRLPDSSSVEMSLDTNDEYVYTWDSSVVADGSVDFRVTAKDSSGNTQTLSFSLFAKNDRVPSTPELGLNATTPLILFASFLSVVALVRFRRQA